MVESVLTTKYHSVIINFGDDGKSSRVGLMSKDTQ